MNFRTLFQGIVMAGIAAFGFGIGVARGGEFTLAHPYVDGGLVDAWARKLSQCIEDVSGVHVEVFGEGKLGRPDNIAVSVSDGIIDLAVLPATALQERWPEIGRLAQPGHVYNLKDMITLSDSTEFLRSMNQLGGRDHNLALLAVGWRHATLVGTEMSIENLQGKRLRSKDTASYEVLKEVGARPVQVPFAETFPALEFGYLDGAVIDAEFAQQNIGKFHIDAVNWSPEFVPFTSPVVVVMSSTAANIFGDDIPDRVSKECRVVTNEFNETTVDKMTAFVEDAQDAGSKVVSLSADDLAKYSEILESIRARRLDAGDPVARAVADALKN